MLQQLLLFQVPWLREQSSISYCVYSAVISALIYPIEAHWIWGGGWLAQLGFHDFAGSCCIHMVGGISALIGAADAWTTYWKVQKRMLMARL